MKKYFYLAALLAFIVYSGGASAQGQGWADVNQSAGASGAQKRQSFQTDHQAEFANQFFVDPEFIIPNATGTGELAHQSINRRSIPSGGYSFGFTGGASFPAAGNLGFQTLQDFFPPQGPTPVLPRQPFPGGPGPTPVPAFPGGPAAPLSGQPIPPGVPDFPVQSFN